VNASLLIPLFAYLHFQLLLLAYLSHPGGEDTVHGPMYSKEGCLMLVLREGPVGNTFTPADPAEVASRKE
jgi:hypothetical protein